MTDAVSSVLAQIRSLQSQLRPESIAPASTGAVGSTGFAETLQNTLRLVNDKQAEASRIAQSFELGDPRADLVKVMLASQEAQVAFRAVVEVRNRLVQAYQDVMNMPL